MTNPSGERHYRGEVQERKVDVSKSDNFADVSIADDISVAMWMFG